MADVSAIKVIVPLEPVVNHHYFGLKSYLDDFVNQVNSASVDVTKYQVVITVETVGGDVVKPDFNL